jgi:subtilisin family serine protease
VINLSLAAEEDEEGIMSHAIAFARHSGVVVVAAAGNLGDDEQSYLAEHPAALGVAATDSADLVAPFSNFGPHIALCAPGAAVVSAIPGNAYAIWEGTSMSAALVSGAAALLAARDPGARPADIEARLQATAVNIDDLNPGHAGLLGAGRLDVAASLAHMGRPQRVPTGLSGQ